MLNFLKSLMNPLEALNLLQLFVLLHLLQNQILWSTYILLSAIVRSAWEVQQGGSLAPTERRDLLLTVSQHIWETMQNYYKFMSNGRSAHPTWINREWLSWSLKLSSRAMKGSWSWERVLIKLICCLRYIRSMKVVICHVEEEVELRWLYISFIVLI